MTREEIQLIRAHLTTLIKASGPDTQVPVKAGTMLAMVDLILDSTAHLSSKGRA